MTITVKPVKMGQIWADNDSRSAGRTLRVIEVTETHVICEAVTNATRHQELIDEAARGERLHPVPIDQRGRRVRIRLDRMRPTSTGYRLVEDVA